MAAKKKAAPAEEVQNTQEGVQNGAQCVETPEPIEEPTPNEIAPETAENDAGEAPVTPLTLEELEGLTLPGDADPDEEQAPQRWSITDDGCADWALKKIKTEKDELDRITALAEQEIARLKEQVEKAQRRYEQNTAFLTSMLEQFFDTVEHKKTKTGTESYRLLHGQLVRKPGGFKPEPDHEKLVAWLRQNGYENLVKVEESARWGDLKKQITFTGTIATITETGEIVEGVNVTETAPAFSVKF